MLRLAPHSLGVERPLLAVSGQIATKISRYETTARQSLKLNVTSFFYAIVRFFQRILLDHYQYQSHKGNQIPIQKQGGSLGTQNGILLA